MVLLLTLRMGSRSVLTEAEVELVRWRRGIEPRGESGDRTSARADLVGTIGKWPNCCSHPRPLLPPSWKEKGLSPPRRHNPLVFVVPAYHTLVLDGFDWDFQASVRFNLSSAVNKSQQHKNILEKYFWGMLGIEPGAAGWEARLLPLCYAAPRATQ